MSPRVQISVTVSGLSRLYGDDLAAVVETARRAEAAGIDQIVMTDHLAIGPHTERYPYGRFPFPNDEPWPEPLTTLAAIAGATERIRLGTGVIIAPLRPALLLAKTVATLDALSVGRVDLGVGTGWQREEFDAAGEAFAGRTARMVDTLRACRALWRDAPATFSSPTVSFSELWCMPRPVQEGGIPIWFGGALGDAMLARIAELGVGWLPIGDDLGAIGNGVKKLRGAFASAGRDPATVGVRANVPAVRSGRSVDLEATFDGVPVLAEAGVTVAAFALAAYVGTRDEIGPFLERVGRHFA